MKESHIHKSSENWAFLKFKTLYAATTKGAESRNGCFFHSCDATLGNHITVIEQWNATLVMLQKAGN